MSVQQLTGLKQPCTGEAMGVAHLGQCMATNAWLKPRDALGFKTTLGDTPIA